MTHPRTDQSEATIGRMEVHPVTLGDTTFYRLDLLWPTSGSGQYGEANIARVAEQKDADRIALCWNSFAAHRSAMEAAEDAIEFELKARPTLSCEDLHHSKNEYHGSDQSCPSLARWNTATEQLRSALTILTAAMETSK